MKRIAGIFKRIPKLLSTETITKKGKHLLEERVALHKGYNAIIKETAQQSVSESTKIANKGSESASRAAQMAKVKFGEASEMARIKVGEVSEMAARSATKAAGSIKEPASEIARESVDTVVKETKGTLRLLGVYSLIAVFVFAVGSNVPYAIARYLNDRERERGKRDARELENVNNS